MLRDVAVIPYEERLNGDPAWALREGSMHFEENSAVHKTLRRITGRLSELGISYAVVGGMALYRHGFRRFTEDVDLLVTEEGLRELHAALEGLGYLPPFKGSKQLRDTDTGVRIEFLVTGQFPGDGKPKPVAFPEPGSSSTELDGIRYLALPALVQLKLASGMTGGTRRMKDLTDVIELIQLLHLPSDFAEQLDPYVRPKYLELWSGLQSEPSRE
jgi:hypothetical protein